MMPYWETKPSSGLTVAECQDRRGAARLPLVMPARLAWKDQRGVARFATVTTRDISPCGVYVESSAPLSIPLFRLVQFQLEPTARAIDKVPDALRHGRVLAAVYRISHATKDSRHGLALRLMVEPGRVAASERERTRATA